MQQKPTSPTLCLPRAETAEEREARLRRKFRVQDGLTFFFFPRSPCARRVWLTLLEKGVRFNAVMVGRGP